MRVTPLLTAALCIGALLGPVAAAQPATAATDRIAHTATATTAAPIDRWSAPGPEEVTEEIGATHTVFRPADLGPPGTRHPVVTWGNGTGGIPAVYRGLLIHLASHGYLVTAANTPLANSGQEMLAGARTLVRADADPGSPYYQRVDTSAIAATGHSQGGAGAMVAAADSLITTTVAVQPGPLAVPQRIRGPILYLAGERDTTVRPELIVEPFYENTPQVEAAYAEFAGVGHFEPLPDGGRFRGLLTAWLDYQLRGDTAAAAQFVGADCGACTDRAIVDYRHHD